MFFCFPHMKHWGHPRLVGSQSQQILGIQRWSSVGAWGAVRLAGTTCPTSGRLPCKSSECLCLDAWFLGCFRKGIFTEFFKMDSCYKSWTWRVWWTCHMSDVFPPLFFLEDVSNVTAVPMWLKSWKSSLLFLCFLFGTAMYLWILLQGSGSSISGLSGNGTKADIRVLSVETIWANY